MKIRRKKKVQQLVCGLALTILAAGMLTGCRVGDTEVVLSSDFPRDQVFRINDESCSLAEAKVFLTNYQNIYGTVYGVNLWEHDFEENSLEQYVKDLTISQLAQIISMDFLAQEQEISLTEEELLSVAEAAKAYYASLSKAEIDYMGVDEACIAKLYRQYGLANKLYASLTVGINAEVSDDEARVMEARQIYVTSQEDAQAVEKGLEDGADFLTMAGTYNEAKTIDITFGRGELPPEVEKAAFALKTEEISGKIAVGDGEYYFIECLNNYNPELTEANKKVILERRRKESFDDVYEAFVTTLSSELNEELWNSVHVEASEEIQTDSFFETYAKYCAW